ncbi:hypothetical protein PAXRUDRAFT_578134 [Paxillus rubicundulus Ve08.2h10]|uniref:Uncharacterized protein n=1 Tax=Paxillus rubicundulus Ve08.2h10 TaxID=930991 RepID=A0A0D0DU57_9AGAM|nr:hypothetical protein PAXRUDRAFT_578134 [Paxillus rubicundulus Ve08.2h10]
MSLQYHSRVRQGHIGSGTLQQLAGDIPLSRRRPYFLGSGEDEGTKEAHNSLVITIHGLDEHSDPLWSRRSELRTTKKGPDHVLLSPTCSMAKYVFLPGSAAPFTTTSLGQSPPLSRAITPLFDLDSQHSVVTTSAPLPQLSSRGLAYPNVLRPPAFPHLVRHLL